MTLTVAQAFKIAFEFWQAAKEGRFALSGLNRENEHLLIFLFNCFMLATKQF